MEGVLRFVISRPKWIEIVGLSILLAAAAAQFKAESDQALTTNYNVQNTFMEIEFNRQKIMELINCSNEHTCTDYERDHIRPEAHLFISLDAWDYQVYLDLLRIGFFLLGGLLLVLGKIVETVQPNTTSVAQ